MVPSSSPLHALGVVGSFVTRPSSVAPPAVVRGWLYDPAEHWWALLVGAPPRTA